MADHDTPTPIWGHSCLECGRDFTHVPGHPDHVLELTVSSSARSPCSPPRSVAV